MNEIQMVDLTTQYNKIKSEIDATILDVVRSGKYINGEAVDRFADELSNYLSVKYVIPCANGTDALQIALMALDLQPGDEVIVPAFTYIAAIEAIALLQLKPVVIDVDPQTFNLNVNQIEQAISPRTKAIIPVHLFGQTVNMEPLMQVARKHGLFVIEDNAQSIGSTYTFSNGEKKQAGTIGDIGTLSFFPSKNLGCFGDGGAMLTNDESLARKLQMIASHGQSRKYIHDQIGCNSRLDTLQAGILLAKLPHLNEFIEARRKAAQYYNNQLRELSEFLEIPSCIASSTHVYHQYTLKIKQNQRDHLQKHLKEKGIPSMIYYPLPVQNQPAYKNLTSVRGCVNETDKLCSSVLSLPMHTELNETQLKFITDQLKQYEILSGTSECNH